MNVIYEPQGRAREYSPLACNIYTGCKHACKYCYCPAIRRQSLEQWAADPQPKVDVVAKFRKDAVKLRGDPRDILFCFMSDPYQDDASAAVMGEVLAIARENQLKAHILTKAGGRAAQHFPILKANKWKFGSTICFMSESMRQEWEPGAPSIESRIEAVKNAHEMGIYTWVSVEPVIDPNEALSVMRALLDCVDLWKVGKLNHFKEAESRVDWRQFLIDTQKTLVGKNVYIKKDLLAYATKPLLPLTFLPENK